MISIEENLLRIVFDVAVNSMDFTSGSLDDEEVLALRRVAEILGVDPMVGTPDTFKCKYEGIHEVWTPAHVAENFCHRCRRIVRPDEQRRFVKL